MNVATACNAAALDGITALLAGGAFELLDNSQVLASLPLQTSGGAFAPASVASPAVANSNAIGSDTSVLPGPITVFKLKTSADASRIEGTVGTSGADLIVTDNVIPVDATEVSCPGGIALSLAIA